VEIHSHYLEQIESLNKWIGFTTSHYLRSFSTPCTHGMLRHLKRYGLKSGREMQ
jgi:hypothetical protein